MKRSPRRPAEALVSDAVKLRDAAHLAQLTAQEIFHNQGNNRCPAAVALDELADRVEAEAGARFVAEQRAKNKNP